MIPDYIDRKKLVSKPGVYIYYDKKGKLLYVGKAVDLSKRIASYFNGHNQSAKTAILVENIASVETIVVESELQALILEANLIKKYLPPFNVKLTDDKDYLYIKVTKDIFPKIVTARKKDLADAMDYFGPFPSSTIVKVTLKRLRRIFPWCSNPPDKPIDFGLETSATEQLKHSDILLTEEGRYRPASLKEGGRLSPNRLKPCFYYHLKLCPGACVGKISPSDYQKSIKMFIKFMDGKQGEMVSDLQKQMIEASDQLQYEKAGQIKRILSGISYITQPTSISMYLDNPNFVDDQRGQALLDLSKSLKIDSDLARIECYDISNFQGIDSTGSMVVLTNGEIDKSQYRRFKIQITGKPNDFAMHAEMMRRRLKNDWPLPDLFLIDGGRGQVRAAAAELEKAGVKRPILGLAKRMEWLYPVEGDVIKLPKRSLGLRLLQKIRDESHRFAITYHRKLRYKSSGLPDETTKS